MLIVTKSSIRALLGYRPCGIDEAVGSLRMLPELIHGNGLDTM
jgi:hypothetical protein